MRHLSKASIWVGPEAPAVGATVALAPVALTRKGRLSTRINDGTSPCSRCMHAQNCRDDTLSGCSGDPMSVSPGGTTIEKTLYRLRCAVAVVTSISPSASSTNLMWTWPHSSSAGSASLGRTG